MALTRLITGASRGIGLAMAEQCLAAGDRVYAVSRRPEQSDALQALAKRYPESLAPLAVDLGDEAAIARLARQVGERTDTLDTLIHAAGLLHDPALGLAPEKRVEDLDADALRRLFAVNAFAPALLAKHCLGLLNHDRRAVFAALSARVGSIVDNHLGGWYGYRASKAAQNQFLRTFAIEARRRAKHLVVLALHPGTVDTALSAPFQRNVPAGKLFTPAFAAGRLLDHMDRATEADSGGFFAWDGTAIPW